MTCGEGNINCGFAGRVAVPRRISQLLSIAATLPKRFPLEPHPNNRRLRAISGFKSLPVITAGRRATPAKTAQVLPVAAWGSPVCSECCFRDFAQLTRRGGRTRHEPSPRNRIGLSPNHHSTGLYHAASRYATEGGRGAGQTDGTGAADATNSPEQIGTMLGMAVNGVRGFPDRVRSGTSRREGPAREQCGSATRCSFGSGGFHDRESPFSSGGGANSERSGKRRPVERAGQVQ